MLCFDYCCLILYQQNRFLFFLFSYHQLKVLKNRSYVFSFLPCSYKFVKRFCMRQYHLMLLLLNIYNKLFFQENKYRLLQALQHVTKNRFFQDLNLRRKADRNSRGNLLKSHFRYLKFYSNPPSRLVRSHCHMSTYWKTKGWNSHF